MNKQWQIKQWGPPPMVTIDKNGGQIERHDTPFNGGKFTIAGPSPQVSDITYHDDKNGSWYGKVFIQHDGSHRILWHGDGLFMPFPNGSSPPINGGQEMDQPEAFWLTLATSPMVSYG